MALLEDVRQALRALARHRALTALAIITLSLGMAAATALFAVVDGVLLRPLPWPESDRLVRVSEWHPGAQSPIPRPLLSTLTAIRWKADPRTIEGVAAWSAGRSSVARREGVERVPGAAVSPILFRLLRATPAAGRLLEEGDAGAGSAPVVVLTAPLARAWFGEAPEALGRSLTIDGRPHQVVGVTPPNFDFPDRETRFFTPYVMPAESDGGMTVFSALARLRPGVGHAQAAAEGTAAARGGPRPQVADLLLGKGAPVEVRVQGLKDELVASIRPALLALAAGAAGLHLIACANVASLLLSRGIRRGRELAVRAALGAGRARVLRPVLAEGLVLALAGGALGLVLAGLALRLLPAWAPEGFPRREDVALDVRVCAFALATAVVSGVAAGLLPALRAGKGDLLPRLQDAGTGTTLGSGPRLHGLLLACESALTVVLLVGSLLLVRSFARLLAVDPGYDPNGVLVARLVFPEDEAAGPRRASTLAAVLERVRGIEGVTATGAGNLTPFLRFDALAGATLPWRGSDGTPVQARARYHAVTPGFAEALGLRLRRGRWLTAEDQARHPRALLVNDTFVTRYVQDGAPVLGRQMKGVFSEPGTVSEIVGVVGDVLKDGLDGPPHPEVYVALGRDDPGTEVSLVVRSAGDPLLMVPALRELVREVDPVAALDGTVALARQLADSVGRPRFAASVASTFAAFSVTLAAAGLYGVLSYEQARRRREMGIRAALGATRRDLIALVLRRALGPTLLGLALGLGLAAFGSRTLARLLFATSPRDSLAFAAGAGILLATAALACLLPARRAARVDPARILRSE